MEETTDEGTSFFLIFTQTDDEGNERPVKLRVNNDGVVQWHDEVSDSTHLSKMPYLRLNLTNTDEGFGEMDLYDDRRNFLGVYRYKVIEDSVLTQSLNVKALEAAFFVLDKFNSGFATLKHQTSDHDN